MDRDEATKKSRQAAEAGRVEFAEQDGVETFDALADEFLDEILGIKSAWISDMSDLSDFGQKNENTYTKIEKRYGVDVRGTDNLLCIFRAISSTNRTPQ